MVIEGTPVSVCIDIIRKYIFEKIGKIIQIQQPILPQYEDKFILALGIACAHFNIEL